MTRLFEKVVADVRALPADEQERVAEVVLAFMGQLQDDWQLI